MSGYKYNIAFMGIKGLPSQHGADRVVESIAEQLSLRDEFRVSVYCRAEYRRRNFSVRSVKRIFIPTVKIKNIDMLLFFICSGIHALLFGKFHLIHLHNIDAALILPLLRLRYRRRIVATSHGSPYRREKWSPLAKRYFRFMEKKFLAHADVATSVGRPLKEYYEKTYRVPVAYIPNGVRPDEPVDFGLIDRLRREHGIGEYVLFAAGRIIPSKGCHLLLDALARIDYRGWTLIAGDDTQMPEYSRTLRQQAGEKVIFTGFIADKARLTGMIRCAALFVFPSTYEANSMMLLEAVAQGVPVIASDIDENRTALNAGDALFFKSDNASDLAEKIKPSLDTEGFLKERTRTVSRHAIKKYFWPGIVNRYVYIYDYLIRSA